MKIKNGLCLLLIIALHFSAYGQHSDCECGDGISSTQGDSPLVTVHLDNDNILSVCGYLVRRLSGGLVIMSEFDVFNCATGEVLLTYGAIETCLVDDVGDTLIITEYISLPAGENYLWEWVDVEFRTQKVYLINNEVFVSDAEPAYQRLEISSDVTDKFMLSLYEQKGGGQLSDPEEVIGKLQVLSLNGSQEAYDILLDFEDFFNITTDGAVAEQLSDALANVEWMKKETK